MDEEEMAEAMALSSGNGITFSQLDEDFDLALALMLQEQENAPKQEKVASPKIPDKPVSVISPEWEALDPNPDIHQLFIQFNYEYFWGALENAEVRWSPQMTLCAGVCVYEHRAGFCSIRLSQPLLKFRPRSDLVETLLHEMIHAYLFVTKNNKDHDGHGPEFLKHMKRINEKSGANISVYHSFHDEVDYQRQHWWKCDGPCQKWSPYFGIVKRAKNRKPSPNDRWWADHQAKCGGKFQKIKEPENYKQKKRKRTSSVSESCSSPKDIRNFFSSQSNIVTVNQIGTAMSHLKTTKPGTQELSQNFAFSGKGHVLGSAISGNLNGNVKPLRGKVPPRKIDASKISEGSQSSPFHNAFTNISRPEAALTKVLVKNVNNVSRLSGMTVPQNWKHVDGLFKSPSATNSAAVLPKRGPPVFFSSSSSDDNENTPTKRFCGAGDTSNSSSDPADEVICPACPARVKMSEINDHLDNCLIP